jgi:hypothetical protein
VRTWNERLRTRLCIASQDHFGDPDDDVIEAPPRIRVLTRLRDLSAANDRRSSSRLSAALVVAAVAAIPAAFYVVGLGFYYDDHFFLGIMSTSHDRSVPGLVNALANEDSKAWLRPAMYGGLAILFRLFGTNPLPYHLFVAALVPVCAVLLYLVLDRLRVPGFLALGVPIVFASAPHYSTDRFWLASYPAPASVALALAGVYALLRACEVRGRRLTFWLVGGGAAIVLSVLLYEVAVPLLIVVVAALWYRGRTGSRSVRITAFSSSLVLAAVLAYKVFAATTLTTGSSYQLGYGGTNFIHHIGYLVSGSVKVNFGTYGLALPYVVCWIFAHRPTWSAAAASLLVGVLVLAYLRRHRELELPTLRHNGTPIWRLLVGAGVALIAVGYASFLVTEQIYFTSAGIDNRVNIVAAIGVAVLAVGLVLRAIQSLPARRQGSGFAVGLALVAATGTLITSTLADYWVAASARQDEVLPRLISALPANIHNATVVLDGVCPEIGPGVVFAAPHDLAGALRSHYQDPTIRANVATTGVVGIESRGLVISAVLPWRTIPLFYPFRSRLFVYDWPRGSSVVLHDAAAARRYLAATPRPSCPPLRSFAWGIRTSRFVPFK